jgi:hypothetical protein
MEEIEGEDRVVGGVSIKHCPVIEHDHARRVISIVRRYG